MAFPTSPVNGQTYNNKIWNAATSAWDDLTTGGVVSDWTSYSLSITGSVSNPTKGTVTEDKALWKRSGTQLEIDYSYTQTGVGTNGSGTYYFSLPPNYTIDLNKVGTTDVLGVAYFSTSSDQMSVASEEGIVMADASGNIYAQLKATDNATNVKIGSSVYGLGNTYLNIHLKFNLPCTQFGANVNLVSDFTEYAYNTSTATTGDNTTSFGYGPEGVPFYSITALGARRVAFQKPIQSTDVITLEVKLGTGNWQTFTGIDAGTGMCSFQYQWNGAAQVAYGVGFYIGNAGTNYVTVQFGTYAGNYGAGYGGVGAAWSTINNGTNRWRVRKVSNGNMAEAPSYIYDSTRTYGLNEPVFYNGTPYKSLQTSNIGHTPDTSVTWWAPTGSGGLVTATAGENITSGQAVYISSTDSKAYIASKMDQTKVTVVGIAIGTVTAPNSVGIITSGSYTNTNFAFTVIGGTVYLGNTGGYTQDLSQIQAGTGEPIVVIGTALTATSLSIGIQAPMLIDGSTDALGNWTSYTPTVSGFGTSPTAAGFWRRVGSDMELRARVLVTNIAGASTLSISMPSGYSIDTSKYASANVTSGKAVWTNVSTGLVYVGTPYNPTADSFNMYGPNITGAWSATLPTNIAVNVAVTIEVTVPISGWTSNINLKSDFTEYASNDMSGGLTAGGVFTAGSVAGPTGSTIGAVASTTAASQTSYRVTFQNVIQQTDKIFIEVSNNTTVWRETSAGTGTVWISQGTSIYGISWAQDATDSSGKSIVVNFGNMGASPSNATYAGAGQAWSAYSGYKWRVRKVSNGNMAEQQVLSAQISNWTKFTPPDTNACWGGITSDDCYWRRSGDSIELYGRFTTTTPAAQPARVYLPSNLSGLTFGFAMTQAAVGHWTRANTTLNNVKNGNIFFQPGTNYINLANQEYGASGTGPATIINANALWAAADTISFRYTAPIAQWVSNINLVSDFTEYASNNRPDAVDDATATYSVSGSGGAFLQAFAPTGNSTIRRIVTFTRPIQSTDLFALEFWNTQNWYEPNNTEFYSNGTTSYGAYIVPYGTNGATVYFHSAYNPITGATWASLSTWKWRVRKISNGNMAESSNYSNSARTFAFM